MFTGRVGGAGYGKGTDIYKFEKIKRAERTALAGGRSGPSGVRKSVLIGAGLCH